MEKIMRLFMPSPAICIGSAILIVMLGTGCGSNNSKTSPTPNSKFLLVANQAGGAVSVFSIDAKSGALKAVAGSPFGSGGAIKVVVDTAGQFAYALNLVSLGVVEFKIDAKSGTLTAMAPVLLSGTPTDMVIDSQSPSRFVFVASTAGVFAYAIDRTSGSLTQTGSFSGAGAHHLGINPNGTFLYASTTIAGSSSIVILSIGSSGTLTPTGTVTAFDPGGEPAGVKFERTNSFAYVPDLQGGIMAYAVNPSNGSLTLISNSPFLGGGDAVTVDPGGKFVYGVSSSFPSLSAFAIQSNGTLVAVQGSPVATNTGPIDVVVDTTNHFVYVANQQVNNVSTYQLDAVVPGRPDPTGTTITGVGPISVAVTP